MLRSANSEAEAGRGTDPGWELPSVAKHVLISSELLTAGRMLDHVWMHPSRPIPSSSFIVSFADILEIAISAVRSSSEQDCARSLRR